VFAIGFQNLVLQILPSTLLVVAVVAVVARGVARTAEAAAVVERRA
jgi:TRAP-type mannitol/chloroaromatic compound transport system permease large subunit